VDEIGVVPGIDFLFGGLFHQFLLFLPNPALEIIPTSAALFFGSTLPVQAMA
jgi:hypothetical protein